MEYKTQDVQQIFKISSETVRQWAIQFKDHLSPLANPGSGRHRLFTVDDLRVFALVSELKGMGKTYEDVEIALRSGQMGDLPETLESGTSPLELNLQTDQYKHQIRALSLQVSSLREENIRFQTMLSERGNQEGELQKARDRLEELREEIGRLKALLEVERSRNQDS